MHFHVRGSVLEGETGRPLEAMLVRVYDKDVVKDDFLGETRTNAAGSFELAFTEARFKDLFEKRPDLYLHVYDPSGRLLVHTTEREVRLDAGRDEFFEIRIPRERIRES